MPISHGPLTSAGMVWVEKIAQPVRPVVVHLPESLDKIIDRRVELLTAYQDRAYADQYRSLVSQVRAAEQRLGKGNRLSLAVARYAFKLMAYKDEYEVARLFTSGAFMEKLHSQFEGDFSLQFNLAAPLFSKKDRTGHLVKTQYGSWIWHAFRVLAKFKGLRGTAFDLFGYSAERKSERQLASDYREMVQQLAAALTADNLEQAIALASLPEQVRGYGHVKQQGMRKYYDEVEKLSRMKCSRASAA